MSDVGNDWMAAMGAMWGEWHNAMTAVPGGAEFAAAASTFAPHVAGAAQDRQSAAPKLDNLFTVGEKWGDFAAAALSLGTVAIDYQVLLGRTWSGAWADYGALSSAHGGRTPSGAAEGAAPGWREAVDHGLAHVNTAMLRLQQSPEYLAIQRRLVVAMTDYRKRQRDLVEALCRDNDLPTRTEVDDLGQYVHRTRREVRKLRAEIDELRREVNLVRRREHAIAAWPQGQRLPTGAMS